MKWDRVLYVTIGVTASVVVVRTLFGRPLLIPALVAAGVALIGTTALSFVLRPRPRP